MIRLLLPMLVVTFLSCEVDSNYSAPSYQETKISLEEQENMNPTDFLSFEGTYKKNLIGEWVIEGDVFNKATVATYKDLTLKVIYYSKTESEIGSENKTIFQYFKPNSSQQFKIKLLGVSGAKTIKVSIVSAKSAN